MSVLPLVDLGDVPTVILDVAAWAVIHAGTGYLAHRLPERRFAHDTWLTRPRCVERSGRLWAVLRVPRWKDRLPEAGDLFAGGVSKRRLPARDREGLEHFARLTRRAELTHWMAAAASPLFVLWNRPWVAGVMVLYGTLVNAPFIAIQRYNRQRVDRVLARLGPSVRTTPG